LRGGVIAVAVAAAGGVRHGRRRGSSAPAALGVGGSPRRGRGWKE
jgi:hypothetical protein